MKPPIPWVGGKGRLFHTIVPLLRLENMAEHNTYHEPCVGGGAVFWGIAEHGHFKRSISDNNHFLINFYACLKSNPDRLRREYNKLVTADQDFYALRADMNTGTGNLFKQAAQFLVFMRTCFNGLFRTNRSGGINTPRGDKTAELLGLDDLMPHSDALKNTDVRFSQYQTIEVKEGDVVFVDPPYLKQFCNYGPDDFGPKQHQALLLQCWIWAKAGARVVLCAANNQASVDIYGEPNATHLLARGINPRHTKPTREAFYVFDSCYLDGIQPASVDTQP